MVVLASGCGDRRPHAPPPAVTRLELAPAAGGSSSSVASRTRALAYDAATWTIASPRHELEEQPDGSTVVVVGGKGEKVIEIAGPFDPDDFNELHLRLASRKRGRLRVELLRGSRAVPAARPQLVPRSKEEEISLSFGLDGPIRDGTPYDRLRLAFDLSPTIRVVAVELVDRALEDWLPAPGAPARRVQAGREVRPAWALSTRAALEAAILVPERGVLRFAVATPANVPRTEGPARVHARVEASGAELLEANVLLEPAFVGWREAELPLTALAGRSANVRFELVRDDGVKDVCALAEPAVVVRRPSPPTVLLVTSDTHRGDHLASAPGAAAVRTPSLDALAARGWLFEDCWSTSNVTIPSHTSIMTGISPRDTGVANNVTFVVDRAQTLAEAFRAGGFATFAVLGSMHISPQLSGLDQGFDRVVLPEGAEQRAGAAVDAVLQGLPGADGVPLFVWLHLFDAHSPYDPPPPFDHMYYGSDGDPFDPTLPLLEAEPDLPRRLRGLRDLDFPRTQYGAEVSYLDHELGRLLVQERVAAGVVAVTADHGEVFARPPVYYAHRGLWPATLHVPLVLSAPGLSPARTAVPVSHLDLGRTLLDLADLGAVPFPGRSLLAPDAEPPPARFAVNAGAKSVSVLRDGWFLVLLLRTNEPERLHAVELYDVGHDPECLRDLAEEHHEVARGLRAALLEWIAARRALDLGTAASLSDDDRENLEALGYLGYDEDDAPADDVWDVLDCRCPRCAAFEE